MIRMLEGYYEAHDSFYRILKVITSFKIQHDIISLFYQNEDGKVAVSDAAGNEYPMKIEYGDFGRLNQVNFNCVKTR